jgi:hypothetical protein
MSAKLVDFINKLSTENSTKKGRGPLREVGLPSAENGGLTRIQDRGMIQKIRRPAWKKMKPR